MENFQRLNSVYIDNVTRTHNKQWYVKQTHVLIDTLYKAEQEFINDASNI